MGVRLVLQLPSADLRQAHIVAATDDNVAIDAFANRLLSLADDAIDSAPDVFSRELACLERQQLITRLHYAIREGGET